MAHAPPDVPYLFVLVMLSWSYDLVMSKLLIILNMNVIIIFNLYCIGTTSTSRTSQNNFMSIANDHNHAGIPIIIIT